MPFVVVGVAEPDPGAGGSSGLLSAWRGSSGRFGVELEAGANVLSAGRSVEAVSWRERCRVRLSMRSVREECGAAALQLLKATR